MKKMIISGFILNCLLVVGAGPLRAAGDFLSPEDKARAESLANQFDDVEKGWEKNRQAYAEQIRKNDLDQARRNAEESGIVFRNPPNAKERIIEVIKKALAYSGDILEEPAFHSQTEYVNSHCPHEDVDRSDPCMKTLFYRNLWFAKTSKDGVCQIGITTLNPSPYGLPLKATRSKASEEVYDRRQESVMYSGDGIGITCRKS